MDVTVQVPMPYCSLQHWTLLPSPITSTTECCFCFGSISSFFLQLLLHSSPVASWALTNLGSSSLTVISFCLFILFMGFSRQEYWSSLPFPSPVDHILSERSTVTCLSWVALHGMAHRFIELCKPLCHNKAVIHEEGIDLLQVRQLEVGCYQRLQMGDLKIYCLSFFGYFFFQIIWQQ